MVSPPSKNEGSATEKVRLAYLVSHPIQYQAPLLRYIAQQPDIDLTVLYGSDFSVRGYQDEGFGVGVKWDVPLLDGYRHEFLPALRDIGTEGIFTPISKGIVRRLERGVDGAPFDALWVHGYATVNAMHGLLAAKATGIPVLLRADIWLRDRVRSGAKLAAKQMFFNMLKELVAGTLPIGTLNQEYWTHYFGDEVPQFLMPYAVDNAYFQQKSREAAATRDVLRRELKLEEGRPVILFASKLQARKLCGELIEAYRQLLERRTPDKAAKTSTPYLLIVGDGEERTTLEEQARGHGLSDVRFCGFRNQSEMPRFFDLCSVFVLPSRHEPWGLIVNEVMNARRPVIVSDDVGCHLDLVTDGVEGFVYPVGDVTALRDALERMFALPETAACMGERAFERISRWSFEEDIAALRRALAHVTHRMIS
jgi:glycosyltransferase involved in cell wall biosynthesis